MFKSMASAIVFRQLYFTFSENIVEIVVLLVDFGFLVWSFNDSYHL